MIVPGLVAFLLGAFLAQFNVFSISIATVIFAAVVFIIATTSGWTVFDSVLLSIIAILAMQAGYISCQLLRTWRK